MRTPQMVASWGHDRLASTVLGVGMAIYAGLQLWLTRGTTLFIDEVAMFEQNNGIHPSALLAPFNEHLELARRALYGVCLGLLGAKTSFLVAKLAEISCVIVLVWLVYLFARSYLGSVAALPLALLLLFFGSAWELNFAVSGIGNVLALAAGTGAMIALRGRGRHAAPLACLLLVVSVASFTTGIAFAVGALVLAATAGELRRRWWVGVIPLALYAAWLLWVRLVYVPANGEVQHVSLSSILLIPNMIGQQAASTAGAITGLNYNFEPIGPFAVFSTSSPFGGVLAAAAAALLIWRLRRGAGPLLWALVAVLLAYWVELAVGSGIGRTPTTVRYVYAAGTISILIAAAAVSAPVRSRRALIVLYGLVALALLGNLARLREGMNFYRSFGTAMRAQLASIEIARPAESPPFKTLLGNPVFVPVTAGPYLRAVDRYGSPAFSEPQLLGESLTLREAADATLVAALRIASTPHPVGVPVRLCRALPAGSPAFEITPPGVELKSGVPATILLGRFGPPSVSAGALAAGRITDLRIPADRSATPWRVTFAPSAPSLTVCGLVR